MSNEKTDMPASQPGLDTFGDFFQRMEAEIHKFFQESGSRQGSMVEKILTAFFAGGHVLLEGIPGLGKTELVKTLVKVLGWTEEVEEKGYSGYRRIQFTPDLMPLDLIGSEIFDQQTHQFDFQKGPIFTHVLLADEINRASPKTQSALLQGMAEMEVTYGNKTRPLGVILDQNDQPLLADHRAQRLFFVIATQNPIEQQGTYPLPEAQLDRFFFKLITPLPGLDQMKAILRTTVTSHPPQINPVIDRPPHEIARLIVGYKKLIRDIPVTEDALRKISLLMAMTWPDRQDFPIAWAIRRGFKTEVQKEMSNKDFQKARTALEEKINEYVQLGVGPRAAQTLLLGLKVLAARQNRKVDDLFVVENAEYLIKEAWRHRLLLNYQAESDQVSADSILQEILNAIWLN